MEMVGRQELGEPTAGLRELRLPGVGIEGGWRCIEKGKPWCERRQLVLHALDVVADARKPKTHLMKSQRIGRHAWFGNGFEHEPLEIPQTSPRLASESFGAMSPEHSAPPALPVAWHGPACQVPQ